MTTANLPPPQCVNDGDDDEDTVILLGCKLVIAAAGIIGTRRRQSGLTYSRRCQTALFRVRRSVEEIYRGMGENYFRRAYRMQYESFCSLHEKLDGAIESFRLQSRGYEKKVDALVATIPFHQ